MFIKIVFLLIFFCLTGIPGLILADNEEFASGTGSEEDPYIVSSAEHLNNVRNYPDAFFERHSPEQSSCLKEIIFLRVR